MISAPANESSGDLSERAAIGQANVNVTFGSANNGRITANAANFYNGKGAQLAGDLTFGTSRYLRQSSTGAVSFTGTVNGTLTATNGRKLAFDRQSLAG
ncbi:MAG: hypothetical protein AB8B78_01315, partial [Polaribacter sp.]